MGTSAWQDGTEDKLATSGTEEAAQLEHCAGGVKWVKGSDVEDAEVEDHNIEKLEVKDNNVEEPEAENWKWVAWTGWREGIS